MRIRMKGKIDDVIDNERVSFNIYENGQKVASVDGPFSDAMSNAMHYASQYAQDGGDIEVRLMKTRKASF